MVITFLCPTISVLLMKGSWTFFNNQTSKKEDYSIIIFLFYYYC